MTRWGLRNKTVDVSATVNSKAYSDAAAAFATAGHSSGAGASSSVSRWGSVGSAAAYDSLDGLFILSARGGERIDIVTNTSRPECNMSSQTEIGVRIGSGSSVSSSIGSGWSNWLLRNRGPHVAKRIKLKGDGYDKDSLYIQCSEIFTLRNEKLHTEA